MIRYFFPASALAIILFACNNNEKQKSSNANSSEMKQHQKDERNKATVLKSISAYAAKDSEFLLAQSVNDVVNIYSGRPPVHGNDSARIVLRQAFNSMESYKPSNQIALADNNYVFIFQYIDVSIKNYASGWHAKQVEIFKFNDDGKLILHTAVNEDLLPKDVRVSF